jgi:uncharacterized RDD family membrane protein YckC
MSEIVESAPTAQPAGFWRRAGAFTVDGVLIGLVGLTLGSTVTDQLARLGVWGRLLGFAVALGYFGVMNSRLSAGQTLGKRLLRIKVVDGRGAPLSVARSFVRFLPFGIPWFLNGAPFPERLLFSPFIYVLSLAVFGVGLSLLYLFIFNRPSRQSLHDLAVGSFVVSSGAEGEVRSAAPWRGHLAICGLFVVAAAIAPVFTTKLAQGETFGPMLKVLRAVNAEPWVVTSQVNRGINYNGQSRTQYFLIVAYLRDSKIQDSARASRLAKLAAEADPTVRSLDVLQVTFVYGFDIGIASSWRTQAHTFAPREL